MAMKKLVMFSIMWLLLAGCSEREPVTENIDDVPAESSFLSVSIVASGAGTRAADEEYEKENGKYKDGTAAENYVKEVLFLFFNDEGAPTYAFKEGNSYQTYYLWEVSKETLDPNEGAGEDHNQTVEKILKENIHIKVPHGQAKPTQLFAVVNPTAKHKTELITKKLSELMTIVEDYEFEGSDNEKPLSKEGKFVMTNSVYYEKNGEDKEIIYTTKINPGDYYDKEEDAKTHPIIVYVERVLARIDLKINIDSKEANRKTSKDGTFYYYYTGTTIDAGTTGFTNGEDIYVRFLGWNVFDTPNKSRLIKSIDDASWDNSTFFGDGLPWNSADFHRSFWAVNPAAGLFGYKTGPFDSKADLDKENGNADSNFESWYNAGNNKVPAPGDDKEYITAYFQENAAPLGANATTTDKIYGDTYADYVAGAPVKPSKVILAAQLVDEDGQPRALAKWAGKFYGSWDALAAQLCNNVLELYYIEKEATDDDKTTTFHKIKPEHLAYKSESGTYKVTVVLSEDGEKQKWYKKEDIQGETDVENIEPIDLPVAKNHIENKTGVATVMVWTKGYTYFYFTIRHLGANGTPAYYGVVRNHIYDATVKSVTGLGTPVSDPNEIIEVTPPDDDTGILAAQVRILSWRLVTQSYDLNW